MFLRKTTAPDGGTQFIVPNPATQWRVPERYFGRHADCIEVDDETVTLKTDKGPLVYLIKARPRPKNVRRAGEDSNYLLELSNG